MKKTNKGISLNAVRNANNKLVARSGSPVRFISDNSKNGAVSFSAVYYGKIYDLNISKANIKEAYAKSLAETIAK
ncbi:hypothetical protein V3Q90_05810 [Flavobacterium oreochromis]|uniref:Uncharacterized protein n=1 Tax=Flavobacterium oreochromis TaxID=2906078 RepID=A0ABW8P6Q8_9FLAO|nr:hypothetical protein [Flavobacterium oreochromis]OWP77872.1 hypothetical protein BWG23_03600 [Flavobacterium oreochromis]